MTDPATAVGDEIRRRRLERGWSQRDLGARMGVLKNAVSRVENAHAIPNVRTLCYFAKALECTVADLVATVEA